MSFRMSSLMHGVMVGVLAALLPVSVLAADTGTLLKEAQYNEHGDLLFSSSAAQSEIQGAGSLGKLALENSVLGDKGSEFGFAAKSPEAKFFLAGSFYSEALALTKSGDLAEAAKRMQAIEDMLVDVGAPTGLYTYTDTVRLHMLSKNGNAKVVAGYLSVFQPLFADFARTQSQNKLTLFQAGAWLTDMGLSAAAGDTTLLRQKLYLERMEANMKRMDAPKGVQKALARIAEITAKSKLSERDTKSVLRLVKKIQSLLG